GGGLLPRAEGGLPVGGRAWRVHDRGVAVLYVPMVGRESPETSWIGPQRLRDFATSRLRRGPVRPQTKRNTQSETVLPAALA
ncbi:MAG: hypothetical protein ACRDD1_05020, partial [Planctomycetia bacterium]